MIEVLVRHWEPIVAPAGAGLPDVLEALVDGKAWPESAESPGTYFNPQHIVAIRESE